MSSEGLTAAPESADAESSTPAPVEVASKLSERAGEAASPAAVETPASSKAAAPPKKKRKWLRRIAVGTAVGLPLSVLGLWIAIHRIEWLGPWLADAGRAVVG